MKIGFYGHSASSWYGDSRSFIDQVKERLGADIVNVGVPQGSEERVLFDIKKTKELDIAVIFHQSHLKYMFLPRCTRDISFKSIPENKAQVLWSENSDGPVDAETFEKEFFSYGKVKEVFGDPETFVRCITDYKKYMSHPDLQRNRFESATLMVDTYCRNRVPKVIHVPGFPYATEMPWFSFTSGIVSYEITALVKNYYERGNTNNISDEGNRLIADKIVEIIQAQNWA